MYLSIAFILRQREEMTTGLLIYSTRKQNCISPNVFMNVKFTLIAFEEGNGKRDKWRENGHVVAFAVCRKWAVLNSE